MRRCSSPPIAAEPRLPRRPGTPRRRGRMTAGAGGSSGPHGSSPLLAAARCPLGVWLRAVRPVAADPPRLRLPLSDPVAGGGLVARRAGRLAVRARPVRARARLDRQGLHLSGDDAALARLDRGGGAVLLSRGLPRARDAVGLVGHEADQRRRGDAHPPARRELGGERVAAWHFVHRLPVESDLGDDRRPALRFGRRAWSAPMRCRASPWRRPASC